MRILLTSDWHGDAVTAGFRRAGDVEAAALKTVAFAKETQVDAWAFLGDLADPDSGSATLRAIETAMLVAERLNDAHIPNWWIAGNHDVIEDGSGRTVLGPLSRACFPTTTVFERPGTIYPGPVVVVHALPFVARSHAYDPPEFVQGLDEDILSGQVTHVFLGHLQLEGAKLGSETVDMPRGRHVAFPTDAVKRYERRLCFNGHYHQRQKIGEVIVPGSLQRLSFGEESNSPGFLVVEV